MRNGKKLSLVKVLYIIVVLIISGYVILLSSGSFEYPERKEIGNIEHGMNVSGVNRENIAEIGKLEAEYLKNPENLELLLKLAHKLNDSGFYEKAIARYTDYLQIDPKKTDVWVDMGVCYFELRKYEEAKATIKKGLEEDPNHQIAHFNLGIINFTSGNKAKAYDWWEKTIKINANSNVAKKAKEFLEKR